MCNLSQESVDDTEDVICQEVEQDEKRVAWMNEIEKKVLGGFLRVALFVFPHSSQIAISAAPPAHVLRFIPNLTL